MIWFKKKLMKNDLKTKQTKITWQKKHNILTENSGKH